MKQLDLFTGKESADHSEGWIISAVKSPDDLETYLSRLSVVDVGLYFLGKAIARRPVSGNYRGLCPFHSERTASFYLRPRPNNFVCYGCGIQGGPLRLWDHLGPVSLEGLLENIGLSEYKRDLLDSTEYFNDVDKSSLGLKEEQQQYYRLFVEAIRRETW